MRFIKSLAAIVLISISGLANAGQATEMLENFLANTEGMQARFQQKLLDPGGLLLQQSAGNFMLKRPGQFMWDYTVPYPQKIISNGKIIWIYDSELEQVSIKNYSEVLSGAPVILLDTRKDLKEDFWVQDKGLVNNMYTVALIPRTSENEFREIRVGLIDNVLRTMMLVDAFEQTTIIEFEQMKINPVLDSALFEFVPPAGTDIVGEQ